MKRAGIFISLFHCSSFSFRAVDVRVNQVQMTLLQKLNYYMNS